MLLVMKDAARAAADSAPRGISSSTVTMYISISSIATNTESYKTPTTHAVAQAQPSSSSSGVTVGGSATTSSTRRAARHRDTPKKKSDVRK